MDAWKELVIGTLEIAPELEVLVSCIGAMFFLEVATNIIALIAGVKR